MKKQLYLVILLLLSVQLAIAQTARYEYWLDNDHEDRTVVANNVTDVALDLDISSLKPGLHYFNFRAQGDSGQWGGLSRYLFMLKEGAEGTSTMTQYEYWLDNDYEQRMVAQGFEFNSPMMLDITNLKSGLHYFNFRTQGSSGQWGGLSRYLFMLKEGAEGTSTMTQYEYWLDNDYEQRMVAQGSEFNSPMMLDITNLKSGLHYFNFRTQGSFGQWGGLSRYLFYVKQDDIGQGQLANIEYWIDERQDVMTQQVTDSTVMIMVDISKMTSGTHTFYMEGVTSNGSRSMLNAYEFNVESVDPEPYAVLSDDNTVLTFYYDNQKVARNGMSVSPFAPGGERSWAGDQSQKTIVFDDSFANCTTITSTADWFSGFQHLETIVGIENLNTQNVTDMNAMFYDCSSLTILDLGSFNTSHVTNMNDMFANSTSLTTIYVGEGWTTEATESNFAQTGEGIHRTFQNCVQLVGGAGTHYDDNDHSAFKAHIDYGLSNPGYFTPKGGYGMASKPTFTHEGNLVFVNSATEGATIRYTIDDVAPTDTTGIVYSDSIRVTRNCTIRAIATRENFTPSEVAEYNVDWFKCEMPEMAWNGDQMIATTATEGAVVEYSLTQSGIETPFDQGGEVSPLKITVTQDVTINLYAVKTGWANSDTLVVDYPYTAWHELLAAVGHGRQTIEAANQSDKVVKVGDCPYAALNAKLTDAENWYAERNSEAADINDLRNQILQLISEVEAELNAVDYVYDADNGVLAINGGTTLAEALDAAGGRDEVAKTITAIVWNSTATLTNSDLQGLDNPNMLVYVQSASQAPANRDNVVIGNDSTGYTAKNIKLTDVTEGNGDFYCPIAFTAEMISYTHEYRQQTEVGVSRGWETIAMPFTVQTIMHETKVLITPFGTDSINKHFWLRQLTQQGLAQARQIEANTPYLISMPNSAAYSAGFNLNGLVTFSSQNVEVPVTQLNVVEAQTGAGDMVLLQPNFKGQSATAMIYALNVDVERDGHPEGSVFEANYRSVRPFEAFTVHHGNGPAPQFISVFEMNGDVTGIEDVRCKMSDGRGDNWYDLNGRKLQQKPTQKGVYLNNGRKVVVR